MTTKFYLHNAATGVSGTLPGATASVNNVAPTRIDDSGTNRSMNATIGISQTSKADTTVASTTAAGTACIVRFISDPIAAQTIAAQDIVMQVGVSESNLNSDFQPGFVLAVWRPSGGGSLVGRLVINPNGAGPEPATTSETDTTLAASSGAVTPVTVQDGDVLVLELWRTVTTQSMATSYTNTVFYDGTTENSATTNAAYLQFINDVAMFTATAIIPDVLMAPMIGG